MRNLRKIFAVLVMFSLVFCQCVPAMASKKLPIGTVTICFDDGNYNSDMDVAFRYMIARKILGEMFIVPKYVNDNDGLHVTYSYLHFLQSKGNFEIANHGFSHLDESVVGLQSFLDDVDLGQQALRGQGFMSVNVFATPFGVGYNLDYTGNVVLDPAIEDGFKKFGYLTISRQAFKGDNADILNDVDSIDPMAVKVMSWKQDTPNADIIVAINRARDEGKSLVLVVHTVNANKRLNLSDNDAISLEKFKIICNYIYAQANAGKIVPMTLSNAVGNLVYNKQLP